MSWYILLTLCVLYIGSTEAGRELPQRDFDTVFLVDSSNNVRDKDKYDLIRRFVVNLTLELVSTNTHRVGIVSFSGVVYRMILKLTSDEAEVHRGMKGMNNTGGFSYVSSALNYTFGKMFNRSIHIGDGKQIVIILGGKPNNYDAITKMAKNLKAKGLEIYSVGIGDDFFKSTKELRTLASLPIKDHTLRTTYKSLLKSTPIMLKKLKKAGFGFIYKTTIIDNKPQRKIHKAHRTPRLHKPVQPKKVFKMNNYTILTTKVVKENKTGLPQKVLDAIKPSELSAENNIIDATEESSNIFNTNQSLDVRRRNGLGAVAATTNTVGTPPTASPDMVGLIKGNTSAPTGPASCVGHIPAANRIVTNGTMVTGIIANNTVPPTDNRACDPTMPLEQGISMGNSGIDATWDYGK